MFIKPLNILFVMILFFSACSTQRVQPSDKQSVVVITTAFRIDAKYKVNIDGEEIKLQKNMLRIITNSGRKYIYITYKMQSAVMDLELKPKHNYYLKVVKMPNGEIKIIKI